jgi:hypothetical protein
MKIANYDIHPANYSKKTPVTLKAIADIILLTIVVVDPLINSMPDFQGQEWVKWIWTTFAVLFKFVTKMVTEKV